MSIPRILLISRKSLTHAEDAIKEQINAYGVQMAIAVAPEDAEQARKLTDAVAQFQHVTAIVADFPLDLAIDENGKCEVIGWPEMKPQESQLITEV